MDSSFNPLPCDRVGKELLLDLRAERVITELGLTFEWESDAAPKFREVRAIIDRIFFGHEEGPKSLDEQALWLRDHKAAHKIELKARKLAQFASDPILEKESFGVQEALMLGFGHAMDPSKMDPRYSPSAWFAGELCKTLNLPPGTITPKKVETAKHTVRDLYKTHLERRQKRLGFTKLSPDESFLNWIKAWGDRTA